MADFTHLRRLAVEETTAVQGGLPEQLRAAATAVPVILERVPTTDQLGEDLEPDLLGLFIGVPFADEDAHGMLPPQIVLFLENLWDFSEGDEAIFREEVRTTYLHELGHYLGLDEDELEKRGLG